MKTTTTAVIGGPFAALAPLRARLAARPRKPDLNTLRVWNGNEFPTLEQLVVAVPPFGGMQRYLDDMSRQ